MKIKIYDKTGKETDTLDLKKQVFGKEVNQDLLAQAIRIYQSNSHQKTSKVKSRSEVRGSRRKIWRQKGTGRARHGDRYAPIFVGGGIAHGPKGLKPQNLKLPKKMKKHALASAILLKLQNKNLAIIKDPKNFKPKTESAASFLSKTASHPKNKVLIITHDKQDKLYQAVKNLQHVKMQRANLLNAYNVIANDYLLVTEKALDTIQNRVKTKK